MSKNKKFIEFLLTAFFLILASYMLLRFVNLPYVGPNATDQNKLSMIARNYNYFGLFATKFQPIITPTKDLPKHPDLYFHHGVLMQVIASGFMRVFGYDFWVGRISYIIPAFLIILVMYFLGKEVRNKNFAILSLIIAVLIPATVVFGRMVQYQGAWTVFFVTLTGFFALKFVKTDKRKFFYLSIISAFLGVLCDWPLTYFSLFLLPLFIKNGKRKEGLILFATVTVTAVFILFYINIFSPIANDILLAILNRSLGSALTSIPFWPFYWVVIIFIRFLIYFNPLFVILSAIYVFNFVKRLRQNKLNNFDLIIFSFFAYGATYVILYPEGSFSHPHWIYGLVPFFALSASETLFPYFKKRLLLVSALIILSIIYVLLIEDWKTNQNLANLYRYNLAKSVSKYFIPYDTIAVNGDTYIDYDLYNYAFLQNARGIAVTKNADFKGARYFVYSCICDLSNNQVNLLANKFKFEEYSSPPGRVFIFFLNEKQDKKIPLAKSVNEKKQETAGPPENLPKKVYRLIVDYLHVPQL